MSRELLILRHGKSDWHANAGTDFERPLNKRGSKGAMRIGQWLHENALVPDRILSSPAQRARQTCLRACRGMGIPETRIEWHHDLYLADRDTLLDILSSCSNEWSRVMMVGHNPGLEDLVWYLGGDEVRVPDDSKVLPTATVAYLEMPDNWADLARGSCRFLSITRARGMK